MAREENRPQDGRLSSKKTCSQQSPRRSLQKRDPTAKNRKSLNEGSCRNQFQRPLILGAQAVEGRYQGAEHWDENQENETAAETESDVRSSRLLLEEGGGGSVRGKREGGGGKRM